MWIAIISIMMAPGGYTNDVRTFQTQFVEVKSLAACKRVINSTKAMHNPGSVQVFGRCVENK